MEFPISASVIVRIALVALVAYLAFALALSSSSHLLCEGSRGKTLRKISQLLVLAPLRVSPNEFGQINASATRRRRFTARTGARWTVARPDWWRRALRV